MKKNKDEFTIHIMHGYDSVESPDGQSGFGCYMKGEYEAYIVDTMPFDQFLQTIAHEYAHYLQDLKGGEFDEWEAEHFCEEE